MNIYFVKRKPWPVPVKGHVISFVVVAPDEHEARRLARKCCGAEGPDAWDNATVEKSGRTDTPQVLLVVSHQEGE